MFGRNQYHFSQSPFTGSPTSDTLWTYETDSPISGSPTIGSDLTIYIGSKDGFLYAVNTDGSLKWMFEAQGGYF